MRSRSSSSSSAVSAPPDESCSRPVGSGRPASTPASSPTSFPRRRQSARATGRSRRPRQTFRTVASRSPGPVERKMMINALNSGARVFMADFEDSNSPTWDNVVEGQINVRDAYRRELALDSPEGKHYRLDDDIATLVIRPRGWHLPEKHVLIDGVPMSASLFDVGLVLFHNARAALDRGTGPYFYLPKLESHLEARLWNDVFCFAQDELGIARGSVRATVLIETILAAFEMDEILYELREHSSGLNAGRWDYIFSVGKEAAEPSSVRPA